MSQSQTCCSQHSVGQNSLGGRQGRVWASRLPWLLGCVFFSLTCCSTVVFSHASPQSNEPPTKETSSEKKVSAKPSGDQEKKPSKKEPVGSNEIPEPEEQVKEKVEEEKPASEPVTDRTDILNELTFDDLKFEMEKGGDFKRSMLTDEINDYNGTTVRIRGYIQPNYKQSGLSRFVFVRDNQECCFGPQAAIYDNILVKLSKGSETDYTVRPVVVEGKFALKEYKGPDGKIWSLYRMYEAQVK